ncbi:MAG: hypothetical protein U0T81_10970 [Saprospiraceae bacterium]
MDSISGDSMQAGMKNSSLVGATIMGIPYGNLKIITANLFAWRAESATGYVNPIDNRQIFFSDIGAYELPSQISSGWKWNSIASSIWPNESYYPMEFSRMVWFHSATMRYILGKVIHCIEASTMAPALHLFIRRPTRLR